MGNARSQADYASWRVLTRKVDAAIVGLQRILSAERVALSPLDPTALDAATHSKLTALQTLQKLSAEREQLGDLRAATGTGSAWERIRGTLSECQRINSANDALVVRELQATRRALAILRGAGEADPELYHADGRTGEPSASRALASV